MIVGCYRKGEAEDAEIYLGALAAILAAYPEAIVARVADPRVGIAGRSQWLPTIAEVRHACEVEMAPIYAEMRRGARAPVEAPEDRSDRPSIKDIMAKYPDLEIGKQDYAVVFPAEPIDYSGKPAKLSPDALAIMGKD